MPLLGTQTYCDVRPNFNILFIYLFTYLSLFCISVGLAAAVPKLELFIALIGAFSCNSLALIIPPLFHTILFWDEFDGMKGKLAIARNGLLFLIGMAGMVSGTIVSVSDILDYFINGDDD